MSTDAERRRIASNLRDMGVRLRDGFDRSQIPMALAIITGSIEKHVISWETILDKLADLIEPEPELVCPPDGVDWPVDADGLPLDPRATYELDGYRVRIWTLGYFRRGTADEVEIEYGDGDDYDAVDPRKLRKVVSE